MISIGIDVSKEKSTVCILKPYGQVIASPYEIAHIESDIKKLVERIHALDAEAKVVLEATGGYHLPLITSLKQAGLFVSVINPLIMKKYASTSLRKGKTDKLDSIRIANFGIDNWFKLIDYSMPEDVYAELKMLGRQYSHYMSVKVQSTLALTDLLDRAMPGIKGLINVKRSDEPTKNKLCDFVEEYWHYDNIRSISEACFVEGYCQWAKRKGYRPNQTKAKSIYAMACNGIPTLSSKASSTKLLVLEAIKILQEINRTLDVILKQMQALASTLPEYGVVSAMNGVGKVLTPRLIAEIGDVRRFHSGSALVAFAGIDSPPYQSGGFIGTQRRISKRGSALLRKTGYEVIKCLKTSKPSQDASVYLYLVKKEKEGKPKRVAKIAALNKFLRIY